MTQKSHALAIQIYTSLAAFLLIMPILLIMNDGPISSLNMIPLSAYQISLLIGVGIAASIAHMFITVAFRHAPVAVLAPLQYLEIITATLFGWWIFGDLPNQTTYIGIAIIVSSGLYVLMREHKVSKEKPAQATGLHTPPPS
jgi:drug/metabolite transporter (DMT)-like permease